MKIMERLFDDMRKSEASRRGRRALGGAPWAAAQGAHARTPRAPRRRKAPHLAMGRAWRASASPASMA
jgi:hypothetical protein